VERPSGKGEWKGRVERASAKAEWKGRVEQARGTGEGNRRGEQAKRGVWWVVMLRAKREHLLFRSYPQQNDDGMTPDDRYHAACASSTPTS